MHVCRIMKGAEIGSEVGFYQGCFYVWSQMLQNETQRQKIKYYVLIMTRSRWRPVGHSIVRI